MYYGLILVAGMPFDRLGGAISCIVSSVPLGALIRAQNARLMPHRPDMTVSFVQWSTFVALFVANGGLVMIVLRWTREALHRAEVEIAEWTRAEKELRESKGDLERINAKLQEAQNEVRTLHGLIPICSHCKKIRYDKGSWTQFEAYVAQHTETQFSHGIFPDCRILFVPQTER